MAILEVQLPHCPLNRTKHLKESYRCRSNTAWNNLLEMLGVVTRTSSKEHVPRFFYRYYLWSNAKRQNTYWTIGEVGF